MKVLDWKCKFCGYDVQIKNMEDEEKADSHLCHHFSDQCRKDVEDAIEELRDDIWDAELDYLKPIDWVKS